MPGGNKKGNPFARRFCHELSLWFSDGEADDWYWLSGGSGARATVRSRRGLRTQGHCGDIAATCSEGEPLTKLITWECKRGYSKYTIADLLDTHPKTKQEVFEQWIQQASEAAERAGTIYWAVVFRRDQRVPMVCFPEALWRDLVSVGVCPKYISPGRGKPRTLSTTEKVLPTPICVLAANVRYLRKFKGKEKKVIEREWLVCFPLSDWMEFVEPKHIHTLLERYDGSE